jgi:hypothetical protein
VAAMRKLFNTANAIHQYNRPWSQDGGAAAIRLLSEVEGVVFPVPVRHARP